MSSEHPSEKHNPRLARRKKRGALLENRAVNNPSAEQRWDGDRVSGTCNLYNVADSLLQSSRKEATESVHSRRKNIRF